MSRLIKQSNREFHLAKRRVAAPGYTIWVADQTVEGEVQDGWHFMDQEVEREDFAQPWVQPLEAETAYAMGDFVTHNGSRWRSLVDANVWEPGVSGWADASSATPTWIQPTGAHDAYQIEAVVSHGGETWKSEVEANVWEPGVYGWRKTALALPSEHFPAWVQPSGAHDAYPLGFRVAHNGSNWESIVAANVWEPGVYGWTEII